MSSIGMASTYVLTPINDGTYTGWSAYGCSGGDYNCIDEYPPSLADYLYASRRSQTSTFVMSDLISSDCAYATNRSVMVRYYATEYTSSQNQFRPMLRTYGNNYYGTVITTTSTPTVYSYTWSVNPYTGGLWTVSEINNMEMGMNAPSIGSGAKVGAMEVRVSCW